MATYYLDYANGNDTTGTGATGAPWKTPDYAFGQISSGDTVLLRGDSSDKATYYRNQGAVPITATSVTVGNDTGHTPVLCRSTEYTSWAKTSGRTNVYEASVPSCTGACNGTQPLMYAADVAACDATENRYYYDSVGGVLYVHIAGGVQPSSIEAVIGGWNIEVNGANSVVDGLIFQWSFNAVHLHADSVTVRNSVARYQAIDYSAGGTSHAWFGTGGDTCRYENCVFTANSKDFFAITAEVVTVGLYEVVSGCVFDGCTFNHGGYQLYVYTARASNVTAINCTFYYGKYALAGVDEASYCTFIDCEQAVGAPEFHHNLVYMAARNASILTTWYGATDMRIMNNTYAYLSPGTPVDQDSGVIVRIYALADTGTLTFKNNLIYQSGCILYWLEASTHTPTIDVDYNAYYLVKTPFRNLAAQGTHNVTSDPLFVDGAGRNLQLQSGSPCINTGVAIAGITDGFYGAAPDIGRYETSTAKRVAIRKA